MAIARDDLLARRVQALQRVFPNRLQHGDTSLTGHVDDFEQTSICQRSNASHHLDSGRALTQRSDRVEAATTNEHSQTAKQGLVGVPQELVAPGDGRAQRLLTKWSVTPWAAQQTETISQPRHHLRRTQEPYARCRELDGQRNSIQAAADLGN